MNSKKFLGVFDKRSSIWFHYVLLTFLLFAAFQFAADFGIVVAGEGLAQLSVDKRFILFIWYFLFISVGDQLIHFFLGVD